jgi:hypothetical protein
MISPSRQKTPQIPGLLSPCNLPTLIGHVIEDGKPDYGRPGHEPDGILTVRGIPPEDVRLAIIVEITCATSSNDEYPTISWIFSIGLIPKDLGRKYGPDS